MSMTCFSSPFRSRRLSTATSYLLQIGQLSGFLVALPSCNRHRPVMLIRSSPVPPQTSTSCLHCHLPLPALDRLKYFDGTIEILNRMKLED
ncbi:hypothetical protein LXL04_003132 [Taraxacum kok-saghyz]